MASQRWKRWSLAAVAIVAFAATACDPPHLSTPPSADVLSKHRIIGTARVIDGDTLEIRGRQLTLWGVDAPELQQTCTRDDGTAWTCGVEAARALADRLDGADVACEPRGRSKSRVIAVCRLDGQDLGAWLVAHGLALDYPVTSRGHYRRLERGASRGGLGMHQGGFEDPWVYRTRQSTR